MTTMTRSELFRLASLRRQTGQKHGRVTISDSTATEEPNSHCVGDNDEMVVNTCVQTARAMLSEGKTFSLEGVALHLHGRIHQRLKKPDRSSGSHDHFSGAGPFLGGPFRG